MLGSSTLGAAPLGSKLNGGFAVDGAATLPSLTATGSASATLPQPETSGSIAFNAQTAIGSVSATLPQPNISGNIALPSIQASGFIIGGAIFITVKPETNITEPTLSTNITE